MIHITVSWIKNLYLRRAALIVTLPVCAVIAFGQAAILALLVILFEPFRRFIEAVSVLIGLAPTFKEQWKERQ